MTPPQTAAQTTDVFFDFVCPYAWRGVELAQVLRERGEGFRLRHFSLAQGNHADNAGQPEPVWWLTDQPLGGEPEAPEGGLSESEQAQRRYLAFARSSLLAFLAAGAAARQGEEESWAFTLALLRAVHEDRQPLDEDAVRAAARTAGLDLDRFAADRADEQALRAGLRADLAQAAELGVFGTPTFALPGGEAAYYRFENLTRDPGEARRWWDLYGEVLRSEAGVATVKRARNRPARKAQGQAR